MKKGSKTKTTIWIIIDVIIVLIVAYFVVGYFISLKLVKNKNQYLKEKLINTKKIVRSTCHDYKLYKIVEYKIPEQSIKYSMKLWFMDDVK